MKELFLSWTLISYSVLSSTNNRAYLRVGESVVFQSEVTEFNNKVKDVECIFGNTLQSKIFKLSKSSQDEKLIFRLKLLKYVKEINFAVEDLKLRQLLGGRLLQCGVEMNSNVVFTKLRGLILSELYVQEYLLAAKNESEELIFFSRLRKLLGKRFDHFVYGN